MSADGIVVEIANWPANDAYKADPTVLNPALDILAKAKGSLGIWHGLQSEDQTTVYLVIAWEKLADHEALIADKDAYPKLGAAIGAAKGDGALSLFHLVFKPTPVPEVHLNAPVTEFAVQTLREGKTNADLEALVWENPVNTDGKAFAVGKKVEADNQYVLAKGWESIEQHRAAGAGGDERVTKFVGAVHQVVDTQVAHVNLTKYQA